MENKDILSEQENHISSQGLTGELIELILPVIALKDMVIFPKSIVPVIIGRKLSVNGLEIALSSNDKEVCIISQSGETEEYPTLDQSLFIGVRVTVLQAIKMPKGNYKVLLEAKDRVKITYFDNGVDQCRAVCVPFLTQYTYSDIEFHALWRHLHRVYNRYLACHNKSSENMINEVVDVTEMEGLLDVLCSQIELKISDQKKVLATSNLYERIEFVIKTIQYEVDILETEERIRQQIQTQIETSQREYYLHEQLKAIQKELKRDNPDEYLEEYKNKLKEKKLSKEAFEKVEREIRRLETMAPLSAEATVSRNYIEWILSLPWNETSIDRVSIQEANQLLNLAHAGLSKVKERILEIIATKKYAQENKRAPIICLVGPPGVGKTSFSRSIAQALNREFVRIALGGIRDEAEIRGHRKTYIGSMPGRIIQGMKKANTINPVFLLDEIDKMSHDMHGDPGSALLEVLDPEQNNQFVDLYLEIPYDLSQVLFIATANQVESIPYPLLDRMELIFLSGYTHQEKLLIAKKFLLPKHLKEHNLTPEKCIILDSAIDLLIHDYTREAGVRQLERFLIRIMRKVIEMILQESEVKQYIIDDNVVRSLFKSPPYQSKIFHRDQNLTGIATGLAWTELGGDILEIEVAVVPGKGNVTLTGQLGDVMQESAQAAISYIRTKIDILGIKKNFMTHYDLHIHLPEGSTPKDGPSAGITICTALISALTKIPVKNTTALTGEITLQGRVLPVGGLKEKFLAAHLNKYTDVICPADHKEISLEILEELENPELNLIFVKTMDEVIENAFVVNPFKEAQKKNTKKKMNNKKNKKKVTKP